MVVKTRGEREPFVREKLERGIVQAVRKRPVSQLQIEEVLNEIEDEAAMLAKSTHEVASKQLGDMILSRLYRIDRVAYVRFASVYRNYENVDEFVQEIDRLQQTQDVDEQPAPTHNDHEEREGDS